MALIPAFFLDCVVAIGFENSNKERQYGSQVKQMLKMNIIVDERHTI
jgi:hypothetical protein